MFKKNHQEKGTKFNFLDYQLQFIRAHHFFRLNDEEGPNQNLNWRIILFSKTYNRVDEILSIDLADLTDYKSSNIKGYRCIFIIIENFSKYFRTFPIKIKNSQTITQDFSNILTNSKRSAVKIKSDRGAKFYISIFQIFSKSKNIHH